MAWLHDCVAPGLSTPGSEPRLIDYTLAAWSALTLLVLRCLVEKYGLPIAAKALERARPGGSKSAHALVDGLWIAVFNGALAGLSWYAVVYHNGDCTPWSTWSCFGGWPAHQPTLWQRLALVLSFAYYTHELAGTVLGVGTQLKVDMVAHHLVTMGLILVAYKCNLFRMSVMWQALFDVSNPILHTAKALHAANIKALAPAKWAAFNLFAVCFLVCRVILGPVAVLWPSFRVAPGVLPLSWCVPIWVLEVFIYALQLVWFRRIVQIALVGDAAAPKHGADAQGAPGGAVGAREGEQQGAHEQEGDALVHVARALEPAGEVVRAACEKQQMGKVE